MPDIEFNDLTMLGVIRDEKDHKLPPEAWTLAQNMRYVDDKVVRLSGWQSVFGTPAVAPFFAMSVQDAAQVWWLWMGAAKGYVWDGATNTDITRTSGGDYSAGVPADWQGTILGGIPIINNGIDDPQFWASYATGTKLADLTNWPASTTCKVIRAFGSYLVAVNVTKSGTNYPHMIKWSHPAEVGSLPSTWDETDATKDAGENELPDVNAGLLRDAMMLGPNMYLYKDRATWRMRRIGGRFIFDFQPFSETSGILAKNCVTIAKDGLLHFVVTQDDVVVHNGQQIESIIDRRMRKALFQSIDPTNYGNSFVVHNPVADEVWFCYPEIGQTFPSRKLIWNYSRSGPGAWSEATFTGRSAAVGVIEESGLGAWSAYTGSWEASEDIWGSSTPNNIVVVDTANTKFQQADVGDTRNGALYTATLQRTGIPFMGQSRDRKLIVDVTKYKMVTRVWCKANGNPFRVRLGSQELIDGPITWGAYATFDPSSDRFVDLVASGPLLAIEFTDLDGQSWSLHGYVMELVPLGRF